MVRDRALSIAVVAACILGERASLRMLRKSRLDAEGRLDEPSVVQLPDAKLFFGIPNSALGVAYYALVAASQFARGASSTPLRGVATGASGAAALTSAYLATRLARQRLECVNCWTSHAVNAALVTLLLVQRQRTRRSGA